MQHSTLQIVVLLAGLVASSSLAKDSADYLSHPPLRELPPVPNRPMDSGSARFVDASIGNDSNDGSEKSPWKTIAFSLSQLNPGDTLYLAGGVYRENVHCALYGTPDKPITLRSRPGQRAIIDGGFREFFDSPATSWVPVENGAPGEFRSARAYRNITGICGMFGDSAVGLHTYWLLSDLRSLNEQWHLDPVKKIFDGDIYCGPGLWYDSITGYVHCRLAHTHNHNPLVSDYVGETDPRKLPLVIAPLTSMPLFLDHAQHIRVQDIVIRGGGEQSILLQYCADVQLDGVFVQCGNLIGQNSGPVNITHSAIYGRVPPWMWRIDSSKGCASSASRDIVQLVTPTILETSLDIEPLALSRAVHNEIVNGRPVGTVHPPLTGDDAKMTQMIHYPANHDWEISCSEFTDGHDGVFLVGRNMRFHHNLLDNMQDDGLDISCAMPREDDSMYVTQNLIRRAVTAISTHNYDVQWKRGKAYIAHNVIDQCQGVQWIRCSDKHPQGEMSSAGIFLLHGSDRAQFIESVYFYQNTCLAPTSGDYAFAQRTMFHLKPGSERRVFNNIFVYLNDTGRYPAPFYGMNVSNLDLQIDGNLHWNPLPTAKAPANYFDKLRTHPLSEFNKLKYPPGFGANDIVGDPKFTSFDATRPMTNDYRLSDVSAAVGKGIVLPADLPDPLRPEKGTRPDIGALPHGSEPLKVGIYADVVKP